MGESREPAPQTSNPVRGDHVVVVGVTGRSTSATSRCSDGGRERGETTHFHPHIRIVAGGGEHDNDHDHLGAHWGRDMSGSRRAAAATMRPAAAGVVFCNHSSPVPGPAGVVVEEGLVAGWAGEEADLSTGRARHVKKGFHRRVPAPERCRWSVPGGRPDGDDRREKPSLRDILSSPLIFPAFSFFHGSRCGILATGRSGFYQDPRRSGQTDTNGVARAKGPGGARRGDGESPGEETIAPSTPSPPSLLFPTCAPATMPYLAVSIPAVAEADKYDFLAAFPSIARSIRELPGVLSVAGGPILAERRRALTEFKFLRIIAFASLEDQKAYEASDVARASRDRHERRAGGPLYDATFAVPAYPYAGQASHGVTAFSRMTLVDAGAEADVEAARRALVARCGKGSESTGGLSVDAPATALSLIGFAGMEEAFTALRGPAWDAWEHYHTFGKEAKDSGADAMVKLEVY
ncbi:unnamed protein product [Diplocarpon coronariae]